MYMFQLFSPLFFNSFNLNNKLFRAKYIFQSNKTYSRSMFSYYFTITITLWDLRELINFVRLIFVHLSMMQIIICNKIDLMHRHLAHMHEHYFVIHEYIFIYISVEHHSYVFGEYGIYLRFLLNRCFWLHSNQLS